MVRLSLALLAASSPILACSWIVPPGVELPSEPASAERGTPAIDVAGPHTVCENDSPQYSGRLDAGGGAEYFFWLATARHGAAEDSPLILWLTGGPGCASSFALLTENGPCRVAGGGPGAWETARHPFSWTEAANVVWVDQPAGVGFSTGVPATGTERGVGEHMVTFLTNFYARFEELRSAPLYVWGESYGGHYASATARAVYRARDDALPFVNLAGVAIGNGWVNPWPQMQSKPIMAFTGGPGGSLTHGVIDRETYEEMEASLPNCSRGITECQTQGEDCFHTLNVDCWGPLTAPIRPTGLNPYDLRTPCGDHPMCYDMSLPQGFLQDPAVQQALGVSPYEPWAMCNQTVWLQFARSGDWLSDLDGWVRDLLAAEIPVLVYNGDTDFMVDWVGSKAWASGLDWPHQTAWNNAADVAFQAAGHVAGMERSVAGLTFVQIYDAGHMVPQDQPEVALDLLREFLSADSRWGPRGAVSAALPIGEAGAPASTTSAGGASAVACAAAFAILGGVAAALRRTSRSAAGEAAEGYAQMGA